MCKKTCVKICNPSVIVKRFLLVCLPTPILIFIPSLEFSKSIYYIVPSVISFMFSILLNFPKIIHILHGRPTYIEDLQDLNSPNERFKNRFIRLFEISHTFILTIVLGLLVDYYLNQLNMTNLTKLEVLGVVRGLISIAYDCDGIVARCLLFLAKKYKTIKSPEITGFPPIELKEISIS